MIYWKDKETTAIHLGTVLVGSIYRGGVLVWQAVRSCFGAGYWMRNKIWDCTDIWRNS